VVLQPRAVEVLRYRGGAAAGFAPHHRCKLGAPTAALRPRRALGSLVVVDLDRDGRAEILARSSELERGAELALAADGKTLAVRRELTSYPLAAVRASKTQLDQIGGALVAGQDLFASSALLYAPGPPPPWHKQLPAAFYALRAASVPGRGGPRRFVGVVDAGGQIQIFGADGDGPLASGQRVGVAFDLVDLDDNGALELIASGPDGGDVEDQLAVYRLTGLGKPSPEGAVLRPLWRSSSLGGQVLDVTHGDFDGNGKLEVVAAVRQRGGAVTLLVLN
jgi:hypothetical protein